MNIENILNEVERGRRKELVYSLFKKGLSHKDLEVKRGTTISLLALPCSMPDKFPELFKEATKDIDDIISILHPSFLNYGLKDKILNESGNISNERLYSFLSAKPSEALELYQKILRGRYYNFRADTNLSYLGDLAKTNPDQAVPLFRMALKDHNKFIRSHATDQLENLVYYKPHELFELIKKAFSDKEEYTRMLAAKSLGASVGMLINSMGFDEAFSLFSKGLNSQYNSVRWVIAESLGNLAAAIVGKVLVYEFELANFLRTYLNSEYVHEKDKDGKPDSLKFRPEDEILTELKELIQNPDRNYERLTRILEAKKAEDLKQMVQCAEESVRDHKLTHILGRGAYKKTYNGVHERWGQEHAVKVISLSPRGRQILESKGLTPEEVMKMEDEKSAAIREYGFDIGERGLQAFRYSYMEGSKIVIVEKKLEKTLQQVVEEYEKEHKKVMPLEMAADYIYKMRVLVEKLHDKGIDTSPSEECYHGDLALKNFMIDKRNDLYLTDYGTFSALCDTISIHYRAPELFSWHPNHIDPFGHDVYSLKKADIYALSVCIWRILTGELPFEIKGLEKPEDDGSMPYEEYLKAREGYERAYYNTVMQTKIGTREEVENSDVFKRAIEARRKDTEFHNFLIFLAEMGLNKDPLRRPSASQYSFYKYS